MKIHIKCTSIRSSNGMQKVCETLYQETKKKEKYNYRGIFHQKFEKFVSLRYNQFSFSYPLYARSLNENTYQIHINASYTKNYFEKKKKYNYRGMFHQNVAKHDLAGVELTRAPLPQVSQYLRLRIKGRCTILVTLIFFFAWKRVVQRPIRFYTRPESPFPAVASK